MAAVVAAGAARADQPYPWQIGFQDPATPVMDRIVEFNGLLSPIVVGITLFVMALMAWVFVRFNARRNPKPSRITHNTLIEFAWTVVPIIILVVIALPSVRLLYFEDRIPEAELTIKAIGHQWYWSYEYPDNGGLTFDAVMKEEGELGPDEPRLLATDNAVVLPVDTTVRVLVTSEDVIHAWTVPAFGVKKDAVPGRVTELWVRVEREGTYYGQCSELCGVNHGFMPIQVEVVSKERFAAWVAAAQAAHGAPAGTRTIAAA
ncbi:MAG: cytochrome c oxidase subunit II, partial [Alphaproteobacteria bacterium]